MLEAHADAQPECLRTVRMKLSVLDQSPIAAGAGPREALANSIALARHADRLGYTRYWAAEHHAFDALASPSPEMLLARITGETQRIRLGSGGVMLPHYSPMKVAENFAMLEALCPGRIDLGVGRAPGGGPLEAFALRRERERGAVPDDFPDQFAELMSWFDQDFAVDHPFRRIHWPARGPTSAIIWLLGSSLWSSAAAAQWGLPYAFAHFFSGESTREALTHYRSRFMPSRHHATPYSSAAVSVICAPDEQEAEYLASSVRLMRRRLHTGAGITPLVPPADAVRELAAVGADGAQRARMPSGAPAQEWPALIVGTVQQVGGVLDDMAAALQLDELHVVTITHDLAPRLRSYELLAAHYGLDAAPA
jgi:luciferase family oxidoreductase group 1